MAESNSTNSSEGHLGIEKEVNDEVFRYAFMAPRGIAFGALANSLSLSMLNTAANQYAAQTMGSSAMAATCAKILAS